MLGYRLLAVCIYKSKYLVPAIVHMQKTSDLTKLLEIKLLPDVGVPAVMSDINRESTCICTEFSI